jgi:hypothetical protein
MLTRKHFIKKADEFIEQLKNIKDSNMDSESWELEEIIIKDINNYCELAIKSNPRFDIGRFNDWITRGLNDNN